MKLTKTTLLAIMASLLLGFIVLLMRRNSRYTVEFVDQQTVRAAMKWPAWKTGFDRCLSLVPPLRKALKPTLDVNATLMELRVSPENIVSNLLVGFPETATNSLRAWVLTSHQLAHSGLQNSDYVRIVGRQRVTTMEGVGGIVSSATPILLDSNRRYTGVEVDVYAKASSGNIQLLANAMLTDSLLMGRTGTNVISIVTNFNVGLRTLFPDGGGVFVFDTKNSNAVLISAQEQRRKK